MAQGAQRWRHGRDDRREECTVNALVGFRLKRVRSFFALGFGVERWNCYETGMTWHAKIYLGPWVLLMDPRKSNADRQHQP